MENQEKKTDGLPEKESGSGQGDKRPREASLCLKPCHRDKFVRMLTGCFRKASDDWHPHDSQRVIDILEQLLSRSIDKSLLNEEEILINGVTFNFHVVENVGSDELLDELLEYDADKWRCIVKAFSQQGTVDIVYEDRYLNSPLGCLMLAQFVRRAAFLFHLSYRSIRIVLSKEDLNVLFDDETLKIDRKFSYAENRDRFLRLCMEKIVGEPFEIVKGNVKHSRTLTINNGLYELSISPGGGIAHGWDIENGPCSTLTVDDLLKNIETNVHCFNRLAHSFDRKGIPYAVEFRPVRTGE